MNLTVRCVHCIAVSSILFLFAAACASAESVESAAVLSLRQFAQRNEYFALTRTYARLPDTQKNEPEALYLCGFAWLQLHRPEQAKPLLLAAVKNGFAGYPNWKSTQGCLADIDTVEKMMPPFFADVPDGVHTKIHASSPKTDWTIPTLNCLPDFVKRATEVFGDELPEINFYLFRDRSAFNAFYMALMGIEVPNGTQDGTGNSNVVLFCERDQNGKINRAPGSGRAIGDVLHEYCHAICNTNYGDNYLAKVPNWFDEGAADAMSAPYAVLGLYPDYDRRLVAAGKKQAPPTYEQMCHELYKDSDLRYALACVTVQEIVHDKGITIIRKIVDRARELQDFEAAIKDSTGKPGFEFYQRAVSRFWKQL